MPIESLNNISTHHAFCAFISHHQLVDQIVRVKCLGGRELRGALRGYDELVNLVLDDCEEFVRGVYFSFMYLIDPVTFSVICLFAYLIEFIDPTV